ncbi:hypothetical protein QBC38DRAFT_550407 [Podospora fimiseda]|uniref:Zn(2)-C6 fungal-type domain-containing protein n=1 Tax=Podospora fimiseda TaxID=252190 RepID=A0AAN6YR48_9PEZI|nr:hypothetical protein QBC38DRAFT_550407 [Podospora fimiseda]
MMEPKRARLGFYRKVKTGCLTCKARKVKCDEAKPHCQRCTTTGRKCNGYQSSAAAGTQKRAITILSSHPSGLFQSDAERRSFSFFQTRAGKLLGGHFNQSFWSRQVMQAAIHYPAIRHLVIALGSAYENLETGNPSKRSEFAFEQCNISIKLLAAPSNDESQTPEQIASVLTASVLFIYLASVQGYIAEAVQHVQSAMKLLKNYDQQQLASPPTSKFPIPLSQLRGLLLSIYGQLRIMIDSVDDNTEKNDMLVSNLQPATLFLSIDEAHSHVEQLLFNTQAFMQHTFYHPPITLKQQESAVARHRHLCQVLHSSRDALDLFESKYWVSDTATQQGIATLKLYHLIVSIRLRLNIFAPQDRENSYDAEDLDRSFREMLALCEVLASSESETARPGCTSGLGYIMPLHMIAARCRDPIVRKKALNLLLASKTTEGLWNGRVSGIIALETINIEEEGKVGRVREVKVEFRGERGAVVKYVTMKDWEEGRAERGRTRGVRERCVEW